MGQQPGEPQLTSDGPGPYHPVYIPQLSITGTINQHRSSGFWSANEN